MKKTLLVLITIAFISSLCCIQLPSAKAEEAKTFTGKVESITPTIRRSSEGPYCKIVVVADTGEESTFFLLGATKVNGLAGNDLSEGGKYLPGLRLKKGERIEVKYSIITNGSMITNGKNGADLINCLD